MLQNSLQAQQEGGCIHKVCKLLGRPRQPLSDMQTLSPLPQERVPQNAENISSLKLIRAPVSNTCWKKSRWFPYAAMMQLGARAAFVNLPLAK